MKLRPVDEFRPTPRVVIRRGSLVRLVGSGGDVVCRLPGDWKVSAVLKARTRTYLEVIGLTKTGGTYTVFVDGKPYKRHGRRWKPYKVRRIA